MDAWDVISNMTGVPVGIFLGSLAVYYLKRGRRDALFATRAEAVMVATLMSIGAVTSGVAMLLVHFVLKTC